MKNGFLDWLAGEKADVVCLQETKVLPEELTEAQRAPKGYRSVWHPAEKKGYSGVAIYARAEPLSVTVGLGDREIDREGRALTAEYPGFTVVNAYFPHSRRDHSRLAFKLAFCAKIERHVERLRKAGRTVVLAGDYNIAHREIDLANPKGNKKTAGFLPEERAWMDGFLEKRGWVDAFRLFTAEGGHYTWWSNRPTVRERNIGWRVDYFCVNPEAADRVKAAAHEPAVRGSDHCPITLELKG